MGLLDALLGAGQGREDSQNFLQRFEQGAPWEGYSDQEVLTRYGTVAGQASPQEYRQAAAEAFSRMSPEQRLEFGRMLQQRAREQRVDLGELEHSDINELQDANRLAGLTTRVHQQPGLLRSILGGGTEQAPTQQAPSQQAGLLASPLAKAALAGIAAMAIKKVLGARASAAGTAAPAETGTATPTGTAGWTPGGIAGTQPGQREPQTAQTEAPAARTAGTERWHEVVRGDTLSAIAKRYYGDAQQYMRIFEANRDQLSDPDRIRTGQRLRIP